MIPPSSACKKTGLVKTKAKREPKVYAPDPNRLLPQSPDAEKGVLSSFVPAPREVGGLCAERSISRSEFFIPSNALLFTTLMELWDKAQPIDFITISQLLNDRNQLEQVGGAAAISELFTHLPTAANVGYYADILREKFTLRSMIEVCTECAARSYDEQDQVQALLDEAESKICAIAGQRFQSANVTTKNLVVEAISSIEQLYARRGQITGLPTGFSDLDKITDGLHGAEMIVIAARPSMGKTALLMNIAEHIAVDCGKPISVFSLEMSSQQLIQRMLCSRARVNLARVRDGFLSERDFPALQAAASKIAESRIFVDDTSSLSILELRAKARRLKQQHDIAALFVDYLQLLRSSSRKSEDNRQIEISEISSGLKGIAKELGIPVVVAAQLNRNPETRAGSSKGRPRLADLRESGSIEQDADLVGLLIREDYYADTDEERETLKGKAQLIIAKQRNGPVGDIPLTFINEFTRFETRAKDADE